MSQGELSPPLASLGLGQISGQDPGRGDQEAGPGEGTRSQSNPRNQAPQGGFKPSCRGAKGTWDSPSSLCTQLPPIPGALPVSRSSPSLLCAGPNSPSSLHSRAEGGPGNDLIDLNPFLISWAQAGGHEATSSCWGVISKVGGSRDGAQCRGHIHIPLIPSWDLPKVALSTAVSPWWGRGSLSWFCQLCSGLQGQSRQQNPST